MIRNLSIRNLILIEKAEIDFGPKLNIITGETGAGKSAILSAIRLLLGERADVDLIREGADLGVVEAMIDGMLVRREIHRSKPSRCFIDDELVSLQELREKLSSIELIDQAAAHKLSENQREYLDAFGKIDDLFTGQFQALKGAEKRALECLELKKSANVSKIEEDLAEIEKVHWQSEEEEKLAIEHHTLTHAQELLEKIANITALLAEISPLKRLTFSLEQFQPLKECTEWLKTATANLDEANRFLLSYADRLDTDPNRLFAVEKRLGQIESLKRKFGSVAEMAVLRTSLKEKIEQFSTIDLALEEANAALKKAQIKTASMAEELTAQRKKAAVLFSAAIVQELITLNLPEVRFSIEILPKPLSQYGADEILFLFAANPGTPMLPTNQVASGGELSRLLFAIKTALAGKEKNSCLIFDEIDSNVGGKTASILGAKLDRMALGKQLIAITHFVQVARFATDHFLVSKKTTSLGAKTLIAKLEEKTRAEEYARMTGGT